MKKFFQSLAVVALLLTTGVATTSCDEETTKLILSILESLNGGQAQQFDGTIKAEGLVAAAEGGWMYLDEKNPATTASCACSLAVTGEEATLTIDQFTVGGVTVSNLVISGITYADGQFGSTEYCFPITCTNSAIGAVQSTEENIQSVNAVVTEGVVKSDGTISFKLRSLYMDKYAFNIDYVGKAIAQ